MSTVVLTGLTGLQCAIADRIWACRTQAELDAVLLVGGPEFVAIRDLMLAAALDTLESLDEANEVLDKFRL